MQSNKYALLAIAALTAVAPFSMEAYLPAIPTIAKELGTSVVQVNFTISAYLIGAAVGELIGGSVSDQIGRKPNVAIGLTVFSLASMGIAFCHDIAILQILRFIQALGCGFAAIVGMPSIRDIFDPETTAKKLPVVIATTMVAPLVAPIIGTFFLIWDWRLIFVFLAIIGVVVMLMFNTYVHARTGSVKGLSLSSVIKQYRRVLHYQAQGRHIALLYLFVQGFVAGIFLSFITNAAWIYLDYFAISAFLLPLFFAVHTGSLVAGNLLISKLIHTVDARTMMRFGTLIQSAVLLFACALALGNQLSLWIFSACLVPIIFGSTMINTSLRAMLLAYFDRLSGSVNSLLSLMRYTFGASAGLLSGLLFNDTLVPVISIMLASSVLTTIMIEFGLPKHRLSEVSSFPRPDDI
jgi:DHA1 family bicyclomycin/chloramphenicol resistance-like MFS transporter